VAGRYKNKRLRYARKKEECERISYLYRWTEQERIDLFFLEISTIKKFLYRRPYRGPTTVYRQGTVDAYWDGLMNQMPEGREPQLKQQADEPQNLQNQMKIEIQGVSLA